MRRGELYTNVFDQGLRANWAQVFGHKSLLLGLMPSRRRPPPPVVPFFNGWDGSGGGGGRNGRGGGSDGGGGGGNSTLWEQDEDADYAGGVSAVGNGTAGVHLV